MVVSWPPCCVPVEAKHATNFSDQGTLAPQSAGLVEEIAHLRSHVSKTRWRAEDNRVGFGKFVYRGDRYVRKTSLGGLGAVFFQDVVGDKFCDLVQRNFRSRDLLDTLGNGLGHFVHVAVHAVENHLQL